MIGTDSIFGMAKTKAELEIELEKVEDALNSGATEIEFNGRKMKMSQNALRLAQQRLLRKLGRKKPNSVTVSTSKGIY